MIFRALWAVYHLQCIPKLFQMWPLEMTLVELFRHRITWSHHTLRIARMAAYQASVNTNTRYRTYYRQLIEQFLTIIFPSSTIGSTTMSQHTVDKASPGEDKG